jgi:hypothetical protein
MNSIAVGSLTPLMGQHIAIPGVGHVSGASDLYVNYGVTTVSVTGSGYVQATQLPCPTGKCGPAPFRWTVYRPSFLISYSSMLHPKLSLPPQAAEAPGSFA